MRRPCFECEQTGFLDWTTKQEHPCPRGCEPPEPMTGKQKSAYLRRLELAAETSRPAAEEDDRHFTRMLFCGAGDRTRFNVAWLIERVEVGLNYLSGRQQGPRWQHQPSSFELDVEEAENDKANRVCEQVARDVAMALTGKEITFVE